MSTTYTTFISKVAFPIQERLKGHATLVTRNLMERSQWWSPAQLEAFRLHRLRALLKRMEQKNPFYSRCLKSIGFTSADLRSLNDLSYLPFLNKQTIRDNLDSLKSKDARRLTCSNTGGSSGEPLTFYIGERVAHDVAAKWRATRWWDVDIGDPEIVVWGSPVELRVQDGVRGLRDRIFRSELLPAFDMSEAKLAYFVERIRARKPRMLFGYPSALSHIARYASAQGIRVDNLGIKAAFVTSERLYEHQREAIANTFGCPVANGYGARDAGFIAHECPQGGMHITAEDVVVEVVDEQGEPLPAGRAGEIVVTHLATGDFPFIRYRTGDIGVLGDSVCACGRGLPMLQDIQGRNTDFVLARDGTVMHGLALIYVVREARGIQSFRVIQESMDLTRIEVVPGPEFGTAQRQQIISGFKRRLGQEVTIAIDTRAQLAPDSSGKFRYVVSKVKID